MNLLLYFYLIHFLADYPLQPNKLVEYKHKTYLGVLLHCLIHLAVLVAVLSPFLHLKSVWIGITVIFVTHNIIDQIKVKLDKKHPKWKLQLYIGDQVTHLLILTGVAFYIGNVTPNTSLDPISLYADKTFISYILILVLSTYFYDVTRYFILTRKKKVPYKRDYKTMIRNVFIVSIAFAIYWIAY
ncbi:DUF3307 domain-containing protein [Patescibacteria group bacterium]|nr:DUF3307 domain-containing protein [Patescibacteria group bacterium]MBU1682760.1 DUF3307 domain-containing protein [Patescibacteria group bacterium]MBU1934860.1 DUF3307 domain-containing protein [Patescibacteria group bacterium]